MTKAISEDATAGAASGEADSTVRRSPKTVNGWRPVSVVIQPAITATKPAGPIEIASRDKRLDWYSFPRQRIHRLSRPSPKISDPRPTITRNDQNVIGTGGQFSLGTVSSPASGASNECFKISDDIFGTSIADFTLASA